MFTDYIRIYKLSGEEVAKAKQLCGKLGKPKQPVDSAAGSSGGSSPLGSAAGSTTKETLVPRIQNVQKQLGVKGNGTLDVVTLQTILTKLDGESATPAVSTTTAQVASPSSLTTQQMTDVLNKLVNKPQ